ncbi:MAG TPA: SIMPL domain-containing protein [Methylococcaceae bacterium]|nr:SIMPL domain-containing protein [Methylococcaceae bacterium]
MKVVKIFIATFALTLIGTPASATQWPDFPFLYAVGTAKREVPPDLATVTFGVEAFDESPENALEVIRKRNVELAVVFKELNIFDNDVEAYEIDKQAVRQQKDYQDLKILGYEVKRNYLVTLRGLGLYQQFLEKLLRLKNVVNIDARFNVANRAKIEAELTVEACSDAKASAERMAGGVGTKLGAVFAISDRAFSDLEERFGMSGSEEKLDRIFQKSMMKGDESTRLIYVPASITVQKRVNVVFKLEH